MPTKRKSLDQIPSYPEPEELYKKLMNSPGWNYKREKTREFFQTRDKSLVALLYLGDFRISEVLPLIKNDFKTKRKYIHIEHVKVSKRKKGNIQFREAKLPLEGERVPFTELILKYLELLKPEQRLYNWSLEKKTFEFGTYFLKNTGQEFIPAHTQRVS